jgi:hypothetical protein
MSWSGEISKQNIRWQVPCDTEKQEGHHGRSRHRQGKPIQVVSTWWAFPIQNRLSDILPGQEGHDLHRRGVGGEWWGDEGWGADLEPQDLEAERV